MNIDSEEFEPIFMDIKERYLSGVYFPKLIVGTGLSIAMNIPGMSKLAEKLEKSFENIGELELQSYKNSGTNIKERSKMKD